MLFLPNLNSLSNPRRKRWWILALTLALVVGVGGWFGYRGFKKHQVRSLVKQAEQLATEHQLEPAFQKVRAALQLAPNDGRGLRLAARILAQGRRAEAFDYWHRAFAQQKPTTEEVLQVLELALVTRRFDVAESYMNQALRLDPIPLKILRAGALICSARRDTVGAAKFAKAYLARQPDDVELRLLLAQNYLAMRQPEAQAAGKSLLREIAQSKQPGAVRALMMLAAQPDLSPDELQECLQRVSAYPGQGILRELMMADLKLRLDASSRADVIGSVFEKYRHGTPEDILLLGRWLNEKGEFKKVTDMIPLATAMETKDLLLVYGDALASLGNWTQLEAILSRDQLPIEPVLAELFRARIARQLKKDRQAATHWAQVHWLAAQHPQAAWYAAEYAERLGETEEAIKAYRRLTHDENYARPAYLALLRLTEKRGSTTELRELMKELVARFPDDPAPRNDLAYLELLSGENVAAAQAMAKQLYEKHPNMLAYRTTLALAYLRANQATVAQSLFREVPVDQTALMPGWQAVRAAVLGASGQPAEARQLAKLIPQDRLRTEERALIAPWQ